MAAIVQALVAGDHLRRHPNRPPEVYVAAHFDTKEARRRDADDGEGEIIEPDFAAHYARIEAEPALPEVVADDGDGLRAGRLIIFLCQRPTGDCAYAQHRKEVAR